MVSFPDPSSVRPILADVSRDYVELDARGGGPRELVVRTTGQTLVHVWDPDDPARNSELIDVNVNALRAVSPGGRTVAYSKIPYYLNSYWNDLHVAVLDRPALVCNVGAEPGWGGVVMSSSGAWLAAFQTTHEPEHRFDLDLIRARGCVRWRVANDVKDFTALPGDRFAVLSDSLPLGLSGMVSLGLLDPPDDRRFTVALAGVAGQVAVAPAPSGGGLDLLYSVAGGWRSDGLYRRRLPGR
jgi:hypothetical protein